MGDNQEEDVGDPGHIPVEKRQGSGDSAIRWFVIGFAIVEAILIGWALFTGVIG